MVIGLFIAYPRYSVAENETNPRSTVFVELGADQDGGQEQFVSIDTLLDEQHIIYFGYGRYQFTESDGQRETIGESGFVNETYSLGIEDIANTPINTGFGFEWWGNDNFVTTQTLNAVLRYNWRNFSFDVSPQMQRIQLVDIQLADTQQNVDFSAEGWTVSATYFSSYDWFVQLQRMENNYHIRDSVLRFLLARAERSVRGRIFSRRRYGRYFSQVSVLEVYRSSITFGTSIDIVDIGLDWSKGESLLSRVISEDISLSLGLPVATNLSLIGRIGQIRFEAQTNLNYASFSVTYQW